MKKYLNIAILVFLAIAIVTCGDGPHKKRKGEWKKHHIEYKSDHYDSLKVKRLKRWMDQDTIHSDSAKKVRMKLWKKRRKQKKDYRK